MIYVKIKLRFMEDNRVLKWVSFKRNDSSCAYVFLMASALDDTKKIRGIQTAMGPLTGRIDVLLYQIQTHKIPTRTITETSLTTILLYVKEIAVLIRRLTRFKSGPQYG